VLTYKYMEPIYKGAWVEPKATDWVLGAESAIPFEKRVDAWSHYLPTHERQRNDLFDSNMCVTYAGLNSLETQIVYLMSNDLLPTTAADFLRDNGYLDENNRPNFNEAFCAKQNGTTIQGNHLGAFWDSVRKTGVIPQSRWVDIKSAQKWEDLMVEIPQELLDLGKEFLKHFDIAYEWTLLGTPNANVMAKEVQHAPLHIAAPVCSPWNVDTVIGLCPDQRLAHATLIYGAVSPEFFMDLDHYSPYEKKLAWNYHLPYAIKGIIRVRIVAPTEKPPAHVFTQHLKIFQISPEVRHLQLALKYLGFFKYPIATGYYGENTRLAVRAFQYKYQLDTPTNLALVNGMYVGPKTRAKLNELMA